MRRLEVAEIVLQQSLEFSPELGVLHGLEGVFADPRIVRRRLGKDGRDGSGHSGKRRRQKGGGDNKISHWSLRLSTRRSDPWRVWRSRLQRSHRFDRS